MIIWIVAGGLVTQASVFLIPYKSQDQNLNTAFWLTFAAAFITWFLIGVFIILIILAIVGVVALFGSGVGEAGMAAEGAAAEGTLLEERFLASRLGRLGKYTRSVEKKRSKFSWFTIIFLIVSLVLITITGILAAIAASEVSKSTTDPSKLRTIYIDCVVAASLCLGSGGLLIIGIIVYFVVGSKKKKQQEQMTQAPDYLTSKQLSLEQKLQRLRQDPFVKKIYQRYLQTKLSQT
ncbi:MAG: hypothetical protein QXV60_01465 [Nitrososphaerota archaeon]